MGPGPVSLDRAKSAAMAARSVDGFHTGTCLLQHLDNVGCTPGRCGTLHIGLKLVIYQVSMASGQMSDWHYSGKKTGKSGICAIAS